MGAANAVSVYIFLDHEDYLVFDGGSLDLIVMCDNLIESDMFVRRLRSNERSTDRKSECGWEED